MSPSFYAGPKRGQLQIDHWSDLIMAVQTGSMTESQWVECKEAVPASSVKANLELARDLASMSVDGGIYVVGLRDRASKAEDVVGTDDDFDTLKGRITQIAAGPRVQPPMQVIFSDPIPHPDVPSRFVLVVTVPPSPSAPHMVDERYWGRNAVGKQPLSGREVDRLYTARRARQDDLARELRALDQDFDPDPTTLRRMLHLHMLARPEIPAKPDFIDSVEASGGLLARCRAAITGHSYRLLPSIAELGRILPHPDGLAIESIVNPQDHETNHLQRERNEEIQRMRLLVASSGAIRLAAGRGGEPRRDGSVDVAVVFIVGVIQQIIALATDVSKSPLLNDGMWTIGVRLVGVRGALGRAPSGWRHEAGRPFQTDVYEQACTVPAAELVAEAPVVRQLLGGLMRGVGLRLADLETLSQEARD